MDRLKLAGKSLFERADGILICAVIVVVASYILGYKLDWSRLDQAPQIETAAEKAESNNESPLVPSEPPPAASSLVSEIAPAPAQSEIAPPPPAAALAPDPSQIAWEDMTRELQALAVKYHGRLAISLKDLRSNRSWTYHPDDLFPSASLIKVPIMACVFAKIHDGRLSLSKRLTLRKHNRISGSGSLKWMREGSRFTVAELLQHMISESDNTATNMLIEEVGMGYIQQEFPKLGLLYTGIYQEGMSLRGGRVEHENYTTAREMSMLMENIYHGEVIDSASSQLMLDILRHKKAVASRLAKGLPHGWEIAHKTGLLRHACHDAAIFLTPQGDYSLTVLTGSNKDYKSAKDFITRIGKLTFVHYGGYPSYASSRRRRQRQLASAR